MKALILAAGLGTRLQPLTHHLPKPLVPVAGAPLLQHLIAKLGRCGVSGIGINLHHRAAVVEDFLAGVALPCPVEVSREPRILGVAGGIRGLAGVLAGEEYFLVHNGDILSDIALAGLADEAVRAGALCCMLVHERSGGNNVCVDERGAVVDIRDALGAGQGTYRRAYTGIAVMHTDILRFIPEGYADLIPVLHGLIRKRPGSVRAIDAGACAWFDIGTIGQYLEAHAAVLVRGAGLIDDAVASAGPHLVGTGTSLADGVHLEGFVSIGRTCTIGTGACLADSVLWDGTTVAPGTVLERAVAGPGWVARGGDV